jgi:DNA-binding transcriptional MerR regulator
VDDDELMTIGRFARLTGLSIGTLRHYDEVGLLPPASVDPASGYRRYRRDQAGRARQIAMLRWDDLPIEEIRQVIDDPAGNVAHDVLARHRRRTTRRSSSANTARTASSSCTSSPARTAWTFLVSPRSGC